MHSHLTEPPLALTLTGFETVGNLSVLIGESATHSHLTEPPLTLTLTDLETLWPNEPNLSQHNGIFGILTGFETMGNLSVLLGESAMHIMKPLGYLSELSALI